MPSKSKAQSEDAARQQRLDRFAVDAERARTEYAEMQEAVDERTARLRRQRLKREAKEASTSGAAKQRDRAKAGARARAQEQVNPARSTTDPYQFRPGQRVRVTSGLTGRAPAGGSYKILDRLPADQSGSNFYRIRSDVEQHDRVVAETQLASVKQ